jgi:hypothetical protein
MPNRELWQNECHPRLLTLHTMSSKLIQNKYSHIPVSLLRTFLRSTTICKYCTGTSAELGAEGDI